MRNTDRVNMHTVANPTPVHGFSCKQGAFVTSEQRRTKEESTKRPGLSDMAKLAQCLLRPTVNVEGEMRATADEDE